MMVAQTQGREMTAATIGRQQLAEGADAGLPDPAPVRRRPPIGKWLAAAFSLGLMVLVASPVVENWLPEPRDSFPLSHYRAFADPRADRQRLTYLVGLDAGGGRYLIPYRFAGTGGPDQVRRQIDRLVERGEAATLCRSVASQLGRSADPLPGLSAIEVITGTYRPSAYVAGDRAPLEETVRARCAPVRSGGP